MTTARETARDEIEEEIEAVLKRDPDAAEIDRAIATYAVVSHALLLSDGKIDPDWSWEEGLLALSVLAEESRARSIDTYETNQKLKAK